MGRKSEVFSFENMARIIGTSPATLWRWHRRIKMNFMKTGDMEYATLTPESLVYLYVIKQLKNHQTPDRWIDEEILPSLDKAFDCYQKEEKGEVLLILLQDPVRKGVASMVRWGEKGSYEEVLEALGFPYCIVSLSKMLESIKKGEIDCLNRMLTLNVA